MANNAEVTIRFRVADDGSLKMISRDIDKATAATNKLNNAQTQNNKVQDEHNYRLNQGVVGAASAGKSFSKLSQTIGNGPNGLVGAYATLAANAFAVSAAFNALKNAAQVTQLMQGLDAQGARTGTTLSLTASRMQEVTNGALSMADAMRATAQATAAGFNTEEIGKLTEVANNASRALGRDLSDSLDRVIKGTAKLEPELLDELGITTKLGEASAQYAITLGKSANALSAYEKKQGFLNAVLAEGELKFGGLSDSIDTNPYDKLSASFQNLTQTVLQTINKMSPLVNLFTGQSALAGGILIFASTIKNQLLPGLVESAEAAKKDAEAHSENVQKQLSGLTKLTTGKRKEVNAYIQALKEGKDATEKFQKAMDEIAQNKLKITGTAEAPIPEESRTKAQIARLAKLEEQEKSLREAQKSRAAVAAESAEADGLAAAESISLLNVKESLTGVMGSLTDVYKANRETLGHSSDAALKFTDKVKVMAKSAGASIRILSSAFLELLPIFGQLMIAAQLFYEGFKWLEKKIRPQAYFDMQQAAGELDEIFSKTNDRAKEMQRLLAPNLNLAEAQTKQFELMSNAIVENVNKLKEFRAAKDQLEKQGQFSGLNALSEEERTAYQNVINQKTDTATRKFLETKNRQGLRTEQLEDPRVRALAESEELKTLENVYASSTPKMQKYVLDFAKTLDFSGDTADYTKTRVANFVTKISDTLKSLGVSAREVQNSFKQLGDSTTKFLNSLKISTSFDDLATSFNANYIATRQFKVDLEAMNTMMGASTEKSEELGVALAGISAESRGWLTGSTNKELRALEEANSKVVDAQKEIETLAKNEDADSKAKVEKLNKQVDSNRAIVSEKAKILDTIEKELEQTRQVVLENQKQARIAAGRLKLEQARQSTISELYEGTAQGESARIANEEKIRNLQLQQLNLQKELVKRQTDYNEDQQNTQKDLITAITGRIKGLKESNTILEAESRTIKKNSERYKEIAKTLETNKNTISDLGIQLKREDIALKQLQISAEDIAQTLISINYERSAILVLNLNEAQKAAKEYQVEMEQVSKAYETIAKRQQQINDIKDLSAAFKKLFGGSTYSDTLDTVGLISEKFSSQKDLLLDQLSIKLEQLSVDKALIDNLKNATGLEVAAREAKSKGLDVEIQNAITLAQSDLDRLEIQKELDILNKVWLDTRKEGLEIQMQALNFLEKEVSAANELRNAEEARAQLVRKLYRQQRGIGDSDAIQRADEIRAAEARYRNTLNEVKIKTSLIDLEFALLKGQQELLKQQIQQRKEVLTTEYGMSANDPVIKQLDATLSVLDSAPAAIDRAAQASKAVLVEGVRQAGLELELILGKGTAPGTDTMSSRIRTRTYGRQEEEEARRQGRETLEAGRAQEPKILADAVKTNTEVQRTIPTKIADLQARANENLKTPLAVLPGVYGVLVHIDAALSKYFGSASYADKLATQQAKDSSKSLEGIASSLSKQELRESRLPFADKAGPQTDFGPRTPFKTKTGMSSSWHKGIDFAQPEGTEIKAKFGGRVVESGFNKGLGEYIKVLREGTTNIYDLYAHLQKGTRLVQGAELRIGETLGKVGETGSATGPHLHYEVFVNDRQVDPRKPIIMNLIQTTDASKAPASAQQGSAQISGNQYVAPDVSKLEAVPLAIQKLADTPISIPFDSAKMEADLADILSRTETQVKQAFTQKLSVNDIVDPAIGALDDLSTRLRTLGPDGEAKAAVVEGLSGMITNFQDFADAIKAGGMTTEDVMNRVASAIGAVAGFIKATSDAKIRNVESEIAAEQKRDGKSAESVARIQALEKKKESMAKKQFNMQKKLMIAQAIASTAAGIAGAFNIRSHWELPIAAVTAGIIGAMGAAQIAIIAGTSYEGGGASQVTPSVPSNISIGKRSETVDLARGPNASAGGEVGYLRGAAGTGTNASNYRTIGSAYGGELMRGYGNRGFVVGEKGPEVITPETPITVTPANDVGQAQAVNATINIQALDSQGVQDVLVAQKGNIIKMLRQAANASGKSFMEDVNVNVYTRPNVGKL